MNTSENKNGNLERQNASDLVRENAGDKNCKISEKDFKPVIEAVLFACGEPISIERLSDITGLDKNITEQKMDALVREYRNNPDRGIFIRRIEDEYVFSTKPELKDFMQRLFLPRNRPPMTQATYETLAIIAYNQPVTRSQVESVRGVSSDSIISRLLEKNLIRECGTLDAPGRPMLFETTGEFLKEFGLSSVRDLPPMDMMMYGTLREIESTIAGSKEGKTDNQITIDQIVDKIIPKKESDSGEDDVKKPDSKEILDISSAFFGSNEDKED